MKLKNENYVNSTLISAYGALEFDEKGFLQTEIDEQALEELSQLRGFEKVESEVKAPKAPEKVEEPEGENETEPEQEEKPKSKRGAHLNQKK